MDNIPSANFKLLDLAEALETRPTPRFDMSGIWHSCGAPSCAIGWGVHWGIINRLGEDKDIGLAGSGVNYTHWRWLFSTEHASRTAQTEARVIRDFVAMRAGSEAGRSQALIGRF